jgi:hypothetical protein
VRGRRLVCIAFLVFSSQLMIGMQCSAGRFSSGGNQPPRAEAVYRMLAKLAQDAIQSGDGVSTARVVVSDGIVTYDLRPTAVTELELRPDRLSPALEMLVRTAVLRRDLQTVAPDQPFWSNHLARLDSLADQMVHAACEIESEEKWHTAQEAYDASAETEFDALKKDLLSYAERSGLKVATTRGSPQGFRVDVKVDPPKARIRIMTELEYKKCDVLNIPLEGHWNDLSPGVHTLIGRYHYRVEWPASLNGPEEGDFEITGDEIRTFYPKAK